MSRFATISEEDLTTLDSAKDSVSTKRTIIRSVKIFRDFLGEENAEFEQLPKYILDSKLRLFFASMRTVKGEDLKKSSFYSLKYGLSRFIKENCNVDISTDIAFESSRKTFKAKLADLQKKGKGSVDHKKEISPEDLNRLMQPDNMAFNCATPVGLQNKVWFNIMYHLCRRGRENLRQMSKSTFAVFTDSSGREYVKQVIDEADKNHGCNATPDDTIGEARMYSQLGSEMCPVKSFKEYIRRLNPNSNDLWQRTHDSFLSTDDVWYSNCPLGKNTLGSMMATISTVAGLSNRYTNHCIRATSISTLDRAGFEARHIIRASGHKSEQSIRSYACRLTESTQRQMSDALNTTLAYQVETSIPAATATETSHDTTSAQDLDLTLQDLNRIFAAENEFTDISNIPVETHNPQPCAPSNTNISYVPQLPVETHNLHTSAPSNPGPALTSNTVNTVNSSSPQIMNFPNLGDSHGYYNITPHMQNCTVHFHFHGK